MKKITRDIQHYYTLYLILGVGVLAFVVYSYDRAFQIATIIALAFAYTTWGMVHHKIHRDLNFNVFLEYLMVSLLGVVIALSLILNA